MKQARRWLAGLSRKPHYPGKPNRAPRRLLMPERLESRNAPGAILPLMPVLTGTFDVDSEFDTDSSLADAECREVRHCYWADMKVRSPELHLSIASFVDALRAAEADADHRNFNCPSARRVPELRVPQEIAALRSAFDSFADDGGVDDGGIDVVFFPVVSTPVVAPPITQPVEADAPEDSSTSPASAPEAIADPTPTGSPNTDTQGAVVTSPPQVVAPAEPVLPVLPPVIPIVVAPPTAAAPEAGEDASVAPAPIASEPEPVVPSPEPVTPSISVISEPPETVEIPAEIPPPMIQPVITDPESEHNIPSPGQADPEPQVEPTAIEPTTTESKTIESEAPLALVATEPEPQATPVVTESEPLVAPVVVESVTVDSESANVPVITPPVVNSSTVSALTTPDQLSASEVDLLLDRATRVTDRTDAIIAIVDRSGRILGVHVEQTVLDDVPNMATLVFAIDGAIAKARTAAFFSNNEAALTSRTVRFISQTTITQREVEANPNSTDDAVRGPGFVAPIGVGGHFPPDVAFTPPVDLFAIEHTNRDSLVHPGVDGVKQSVTVDDDGNPVSASGDDILLSSRFGANFVAGQEIPVPESYGLVSNLLTNAQSRGIATLPGGVPLYKIDPADGLSKLVGGIGVFFPGEDSNPDEYGYATFEQGFVAGIGQTTQQRLNAPLVIEAEYTATVIAANLGTVGGLTRVADIGLPALPGGGRIDLAGITLESFGPHPFKLNTFLAMGASRFSEGVDTGTRMPVTKGGALTLAGEQVPSGWLVDPTAGTNLTAQEVEDIILRGVAEAQRVRAAIRLPLGERTSMVLAVADTDGTVLGLFRMDDAAFFSIDVAVAKARNVVYYADAGEVKDIDRVDADGDSVPDVAAGVAFTNRTFRFLAEPRFPSGIEGTDPPPFSTLNTPGVNPHTAENLPGVTPDASDFTTVLGYDAFHPGTNFREDVPSTGYQNGIVFFPGSTALYRNGVLVGGFGVSGDGVDQDDVVTYFGAGEFLPGVNSPVTRADEVFVRDVRLPYQKFLRNPHG